MISKKKYSGFAIAIAWPETYCKQPGSWYDSLTTSLGINKHHYYKVGHAALVLIDLLTCKCHYFDFGRYHTPFQYGRVRSELTDHNLKINTKAKISKDENTIDNFIEIVTELQENNECHGEGELHASYTKIDFKKAYQKVMLMQQKCPIAYGPFRYQGSNCSRFVNKIILAGSLNLLEKLRLTFLIPLTPTPLNNVNALSNKTTLPKLLASPVFIPTPIPDKSRLKGTLSAPKKADNIPQNSQWLSGEGAGSWFTIQHNKNSYLISRYSPNGKLECQGNFKVSNNETFDINKPYAFAHLSHCQTVCIKQKNVLVKFRKEN